MSPPTPRLVLRDLPLPLRLVLSAFLLSVGLGYGSAVVQLHFQHTSKNGTALPGPAEVVQRFHGKNDLRSPLERLLTAPEDAPFNGNGSMAPAFTTRSDGWKRALRKRPEPQLRAEREGEKKALLAWLKDGARKNYYTADAFPLPADLKGQPLTAEYRDGDRVKVRSILTDRCARCHNPTDGDAKAQDFPLTNHEQLARYVHVDRGMISQEKLTQSTHVHMLGFAMLYLLTGAIFALSSYPAWVRLLLAPLVLVAQVVDISCWWLARIEGPLGEQFALAILGTGAVVGVGLVLQVVLSLFNMYGPSGKAVLLALFLAAGAGGYVLEEKVIVPQLQAERDEYNAAQEAAKQAKPDQTKEEPPAHE